MPESISVSSGFAGSPQSGGSFGGGAFRGLAWLAGALATTAAVAVGAVLAIFFAATLAVIAVMGAATLWLAGIALRARRTVHANDPSIIEARNFGGRSWVAYGWDETGR
jgi:hypothetical protein